uniref:C-type lectin domain-containing protein n=1 Tax=Ciona intestinalis TaxID=7719 RepID=H2XKA0_CIOIN
WADARLHCQSEGGDLVSINSPEEQGFIEFHVAYLNVWAVWTGGLDSYNGPDFFPDVIDAFDGGWRWSDGTPFNFVNWVDHPPGEPNNESDEDCMEIRSDTGLWNDVPCGGYYGYICERPDPAHINPYLTTSETGDHLGCPSGWFGWKNWCYYLPRKNHLVDYSEATQRCQSYGAELVSVLDQGEQDFIINTIFFDWASAEDVWIGLNDFETSNYFKWSDGSTVTYTNWNFNEPGGDGSGHCTKMYKFSGFWNNKDCSKELNYMCKMDKLPVNQAQQAVDGCPSGWQGNEASCYLFDITPSVWVNAEDYCSDVGGHLVTINNYFEQMYVTSQAAQTSHPDDGENFLIGLAAYLDSSGGLTYKWASGEPVTFTAWDKDEPGREDGMVGCITLDKDTGFWSQSRPVGCGSPGYRICEIPRTGYTTPMVPTPPSPNGNCPDGWYGWSNATFCYQIYINEMTDPTQQLNWETAKLHCESQGANLASIHSEQEETIITTGVTGADQSYAFWIGLKRQDDGMMGWSDKTPLSFTDWGNDEPNNHNGREECTEAYLSPDSQYWNDLNCDAARNWICKVERAYTPPTGTLSPQICGSDVDWVAYTSSYTQQQKCYYFANNPVKSWKSANDYCATLGGSLVTIQTLDEQEFVTARVGGGGCINALWIGMVQDGMNGPYVWIDGTPLTFENWIGGQPNDNNGKELCVLMYTYAGLWSDDNCGLPNGFICQKRTTATPGMPAPTPVVPGGCPAGWTTYGSKCYLEVGLTDNSLRKNWNDAEAYCNNNHAYLASVPNAYYNSFLTSQLFGATINIWIGFNAQGTSRTFKWSDNEDVTYTNWAPNEPNNSGGLYSYLEECGEIIWSSDKAGQWNDIPCTEVRPFFCNIFRSTEFSQDNNPAAPDCPPNHNFVQWDTGCYKTYTDMNGYKSWNDASMACANEGTQMASVWNVYEESFIHSMFWPQEGTTNFDSMWIGLNFQYNSSTGATSYQWSDGSPVVYTKWGTNEPQNPTNGQGCAHMDNKGLWYMNTNIGECSSMKLAYVCKHETCIYTVVIPPQTPGIGECEATWLPLGDYCYSIEFVMQRSFGDAGAECQSRMAYLASVHSDIENKALLSWLNEKTAWLGLKRNGWGGWDWVDGTAVDYTNWGESEPNNAGETGEACVEMYNNGKWNDNFCSNLRGYVCKKHK